MKKNYIIVGLALVVGAFFVFYGSNTDLFKGSLTITDTSGAEVTIDPEMVHPLEVYKIANRFLFAELTSSGVDREAVVPIVAELNKNVTSMQNVFNLDGFDRVRIKKNENGEYVECDDTDTAEDCLTFNDLDISKADMQRILGLQDYKQQPALQSAASKTTIDLTQEDIQMISEALDSSAQ